MAHTLAGGVPETRVGGKVLPRGCIGSAEEAVECAPAEGVGEGRGQGAGERQDESGRLLSKCISDLPGEGKSQVPKRAGER